MIVGKFQFRPTQFFHMQHSQLEILVFLYCLNFKISEILIQSIMTNLYKN